MVARRAAERKRSARALRYVGSRAECAIGSAAGGLPSACGQRRTGIEGIQAHAGCKIVWLDVGAKTPRRPNAWDGVQRNIGRIHRNPLLPCGLQKLQIAWAVDALEQRVIKMVGLLQRPQRARLQCRSYLVLSLRHFMAGHHTSAVHLQLALVSGMVGVVKNMHGASLQEDAFWRTKLKECRLSMMGKLASS